MNDLKTAGNTQNQSRSLAIVRDRGNRLGRFALAAAMALICLPSVSATGNARTTLQAAAGSFPDYLDPQLSYTFEGWRATYDTYIPLLTYRHATGRAGSDIVPGLASELPRVSNGGKTYTLFLRPGLEYSDGTPVRASDFESAIERLFEVDSGGSSFYADIVGAHRFRRSRQGEISGIDTTNRSGKIVIHLVRPRSWFTDLLALPFAAPIPPSTPSADQTFHPPPATGPYAIVSSEPGRGWSYERNPRWDANNGALMPQLPSGYVDRIDVSVVRSRLAQIKQVERGTLDWMMDSPPSNEYARLKRRYGRARFQTQPTLATYYFWLNTSRPPFNDLRVREAVNLAVNRSALQGIYGGQLTATQQILPPGMPGYQKFALFPHNISKARRLMAKADPADREITVWTDTESPNREAATYYRAQLERIGFDAHLKVVNAASYFTVIGSIATPDLDTGWSNWFADFANPGDFFGSLLSGASIHPFYNGNFARIDVPALDAKIATLRATQLGPSQERQYARLDRNYMQLAPWVPFGTQMASTFASKAVALEQLVWNPTFGADLASLQFRPG